MKKINFLDVIYYIILFGGMIYFTLLTSNLKNCSCSSKGVVTDTIFYADKFEEGVNMYQRKHCPCGDSLTFLRFIDTTNPKLILPKTGSNY